MTADQSQVPDREASSDSLRAPGVRTSPSLPSTSTRDCLIVILSGGLVFPACSSAILLIESERLRWSSPELDRWFTIGMIVAGTLISCAGVVRLPRLNFAIRGTLCVVTLVVYPVLWMIITTIVLVALMVLGILDRNLDGIH